MDRYINVELYSALYKSFMLISNWEYIYRNLFIEQCCIKTYKFRLNILTFAINFEEKAISDLELDYVKLIIKPEQLKFINEISKVVCDQIKIPVLAMRAITWKAMMDWQNRHNKPISEISGMSPPQRIIAAKQVFNLGRKHLKCMLSQPKQESEIILDIAFEKAFKIYVEYLNRVNR